jgi:signal peptidase II
MYKIKFKKFVLNLITITVIFLADRVSKIYILKIADLQNVVDIYLTPYANFYLIWNKGIAFGLFSFEGNFLYNLITLIIMTIIIAVFVLTINTNGFRRYALLFVLGGALGNFFDRIYYSAVPDFIDLHINNFHWFIFNVADIFITLGIICLISAEIFFKDN